METFTHLSNFIEEFISKLQAGYLLAFSSAFLIAIFTIPVIIKIAKKKNLLDRPNHRKEHTVPVPTLGGIGIFVSILIAVLLWAGDNYSIELFCLIISLILLFITGIFDDLKEVKATKKLLIQITAAALITWSDVRIESLFGLFGIYELSVSTQYLLTILVIAGITNAINLLDGINGLAGGISCINAFVFFILFAWMEVGLYTIIAISLAGALLGFLRYNFNKAKIFMGDTGSLVIGFISAVLAIKYLQTNTTPDPYALIIVFGILILPVFDTLRVFGIRILQKKSPFSPDKNHIHHLLVKTGFNHKKSALIMYAANSILITTAILLSQYQVNVLTAIILLTGTAVILSEFITIKRILRIRSRLKKLFLKKEQKQSENHLLTKLN